MIGSGGVWVDLHLDLLVLTLGVLIAIQRVMHVEESDQRDQIGHNEVDTLSKLKKAWKLTR